jgi:hypothetical protein
MDAIERIEVGIGSIDGYLREEPEYLRKVWCCLLNKAKRVTKTNFIAMDSALRV